MRTLYSIHKYVTLCSECVEGSSQFGNCSHWQRQEWFAVAIHNGISAYIHYIQWTKVRKTASPLGRIPRSIMSIDSLTSQFFIYSKLESRKFPSNLPVNVKNVIGFILSNLDRPSRIHAMILILKQKNIIAIDDGLAILIHEVTDSISYNLQNWRKLPHKRNNILRRIQMLQQLYLALLRVQSANNLKSVDTLVRNILNLWTGNE